MIEKMIVLDTETTGLNPRVNKPTHIGFYNGEFTMVDISDKKDLTDVLGDIYKTKVPLIMHNGKFDTNMLSWNHGVWIPWTYDTMLLSQLFDSRQKHTLDNLGQLYLGEGKWGDKKILAAIKKGEFWKLPQEDQTNYLRRDCEVTWNLFKFFELKIDQNLWNLYEDFDLPVSLAIANVENNGFTIDTKLLQQYKKQLEEKYDLQKQALYEQFGNINIDSPIQLKRLIEEQLGLEIKSTDEETLRKLTKYIPELSTIIDYRETKKYAKTYIKNLEENMFEGKVYPQFHLAGDYHASKGRGTQTGRTSSSNPNLQNQPRASSGPVCIRKLFTASPGQVLLAGDYSQLELKVAAYLSEEWNLLKGDIHQQAADILKVPRQDGKTCNFAMLYGATESKLYQSSHGSKNVRDYVKWFKQNFPKVIKWTESIRQIVGTEGRVQNFSGRLRYMDDINAGPNSIIQGTAGDIGKEALLRLYRHNYRILGLIHDEVIVEVPRNYVKQAADEMERIMTDGLELHGPINERVSLEVNCKAGTNWGEMNSVFD